MYRINQATGSIQTTTGYELLAVWWVETILRPGAGAEIAFLINIICCQFEGCLDEEKLIST